MKFFTKLQYYLLFAIGFIMAGLTSFITGDVSLTNLRNASYYISTLLTYAAFLCIVASTVLKKVDDFTATDEEYLTLDKGIKHFAMNTYRPTAFSKFLAKLNLERKKRQFHHDITKSLQLLDDTATDKERAIMVIGTEEEKRNCDYCYKREAYIKQLDPDWIDKNVALLSVKYDQVTYDIILGGFYTKNRDGVNPFITKHKAWKMVRDRAPGMLMSFAIMSLVSAMVLDIAYSPNAVLQLVAKMMALLWNIYTALRYAEQWIQTVTLKDIRFRYGIVAEYNAWVINEYKEQEKLK
jgi:hypothetical protein